MHTFQCPASTSSLFCCPRFPCSRHSVAWLAIVVTALCSSQTSLADSVSFRNDVMAVLSKAGCNQGACHGNQNGKNGFKLSLRGDDPLFDLASLTRDTFARRTNALQPA